jgi:hypothetical protein
MIPVETVKAPVSLLKEKQCTMPCCMQLLPEAQLPTKDHIFPKIVATHHNLVLGSIVFQEANLIKVCRERHTRIDYTKILMYTSHGLSGVVEYNGSHYPRVAEQFLERQQQQWEYLFSRLGDNIGKLKDSHRVPPRFKKDYERAESIIDRCLNRWATGKF